LAQVSDLPNGEAAAIVTMTSMLASGQIVVVETDEDRFLGTAEVVGEQLVVRSGFVGRPVIVELSDVERITPVDEHPDLDELLELD
jgi:hypothetical protein